MVTSILRVDSDPFLTDISILNPGPLSTPSGSANVLHRHRFGSIYLTMAPCIVIALNFLCISSLPPIMIAITKVITLQMISKAIYFFLSDFRRQVFLNFFYCL